jgi:hypothetical protein
MATLRHGRFQRRRDERVFHKGMADIISANSLTIKVIDGCGVFNEQACRDVRYVRRSRVDPRRAVGRFEYGMVFRFDIHGWPNPNGPAVHDAPAPLRDLLASVVKTICGGTPIVVYWRPVCVSQVEAQASIVPPRRARQKADHTVIGGYHSYVMAAEKGYCW